MYIPAVLTWAIFELSQKPDLMRRVQQEIDDVCGDRDPTFEDIPKMQVRQCKICGVNRMFL